MPVEFGLFRKGEAADPTQSLLDPVSITMVCFSVRILERPGC